MNGQAGSFNDKSEEKTRTACTSMHYNFWALKNFFFKMCPVFREEDVITFAVNWVLINEINVQNKYH